MTCAGITALAAQYPELLRLGLDGCERATLAGVMAVVSEHPELEIDFQGWRYHLGRRSFRCFLTKAALQAAAKEWCTDEAAATAKYGEIAGWDVSRITDMSQVAPTHAHHLGAAPCSVVPQVISHV